MNTINLNGKWKLGYCDIGVGSFAHRPKMQMECPVPGDVHIPFIENGMIPEPLIDKNSEACRWLEDKEFWYEKEFTVSEKDILDRTVLTFEGLDCSADVWLNGTYLGHHSNSFVECEYEIGQTLAAGKNSIVVRLDNGLAEVREKPLYDMDKMWNNDQPYRAWMRKPQFVNGWDWTLWLPTCGIWRPVYIRSYQSARILEVYPYGVFDGGIPAEGMPSKLHVKTVAESFDRSCSMRCEVLDAEGTVLYAEQQDHPTDTCEFQFEIEHSRLWWCNGLGEPYLYTVKVSLYRFGELVQEVSKEYGIRTVSIEQKALSDKESTFTFVLNGQRVFCKGANHVPADCLFGRVTDEKTDALLHMAADAHMNMIRVWGGGVYESDHFMEQCDRLGLMVWHDFMFACGYYPDFDQEYMVNVKDEVIRAVKRLRSHPSLIGWSGNNEVQEMYQGMRGYMPEISWYGGSIYEKLLPEVVAAYSENVIYRESSPFGGDNPADIEQGDQHIWHFTHRPQYEHYLDLWRFTDMNIKFLSEFGIIGCMNLESARKCISADKLSIDSEEWLHHSNTSSEHRLLGMVTDTYFGSHEKMSLQEYILKSQVIQAEIIRHIYDEFRSRKFVCSGLLFWTLGDSYGINNWALIDYYLDKRPVYYYLKRSMAPLTVMVKGYDVQNFDGMEHYSQYFAGSPKPLEVWVLNDCLETQEAEVRYALTDFDGTVIQSGSVCHTAHANASEKALEFSLVDVSFVPERTVFRVSLWKNGQPAGENRYFFAPYAKLCLKKTELTYSLQRISEDTAEMTIQADTFVWMLHIGDTDRIQLSDNDFDLYPGEPRKVTVKAAEIADYKPSFHSLNEY